MLWRKLSLDVVSELAQRRSRKRVEMSSDHSEL